jgi:hypothetical protein
MVKGMLVAARRAHIYVFWGCDMADVVMGNFTRQSSCSQTLPTVYIYPLMPPSVPVRYCTLPQDYSRLTESHRSHRGNVT